MWWNKKWRRVERKTERNWKVDHERPGIPDISSFGAGYPGHVYTANASNEDLSANPTHLQGRPLIFRSKSNKKLCALCQPRQSRENQSANLRWAFSLYCGPHQNSVGDGHIVNKRMLTFRIKSDLTSHHRLTPSSLRNSVAPTPLITSFFFLDVLVFRDANLTRERLRLEGYGMAGCLENRYVGGSRSSSSSRLLKAKDDPDFGANGIRCVIVPLLFVVQWSWDIVTSPSVLGTDRPTDDVEATEIPDTVLDVFLPVRTRIESRRENLEGDVGMALSRVVVVRDVFQLV